jgi:mRNA interferase MazF
MSLPTKIYKQFDIVVVPFPFTDRSATKRRPALVLSDSILFNNDAGHTVMAMITTATHSPWPLDISIQELEPSGLKQPSVIRMKLFTLDNSLIIKHIGQLTEPDQKSIEEALKKLFNMVE